MDVIRELQDAITKEVLKIVEDKLKEVCEVWGIDPEEHDEVSRRVEIRNYLDVENVDHGQYVFVDGFLVMKYFHPESIPYDMFDPKEQRKFGFTFQSSEIAKPHDFGINK